MSSGRPAARSHSSLEAFRRGGFRLGKDSEGSPARVRSTVRDPRPPSVCCVSRPARRHRGGDLRARPLLLASQTRGSWCAAGCPRRLPPPCLKASTSIATPDRCSLDSANIVLGGVALCGPRHASDPHPTCPCACSRTPPPAPPCRRRPSRRVCSP